ncbi:hypothetical protein [Lysinibacillus fusiformis]|uniref:hypothetical protein n=1 Tax=Lysinibacillus fusiformis TaxID=28031 RepID=UPI00380C7C61
MFKIIYIVINGSPNGEIYVYTVIENGEQYKLITRDHKKFTVYKLMNKLYIRQKK